MIAVLGAGRAITTGLIVTLVGFGFGFSLLPRLLLAGLVALQKFLTKEIERRRT